MNQYLKKIVCKIQCDDEVGTGFFITPEIVVTVKHVVAKCRKRKPIQIFYFSNGELLTFTAEPISSNWCSFEIVALKVNGNLSESCRPVGLVDVSEHWKLIGIGCYEEHPNRIDFDVKDISGKELQLKPLNESIPNYQGFSGSPLFFHGYIVGVLKKQLSQDNVITRLSAWNCKQLYEDMHSQGIEFQADTLSNKEILELQHGKLLAYSQKELISLVTRDNYTKPDSYIPRLLLQQKKTIKYGQDNIWWSLLSNRKISITEAFDECNHKMLLLSDA